MGHARGAATIAVAHIASPERILGDLSFAPPLMAAQLQRKTRVRLTGILSMYAEHSDADDAPLYGVLYVCDRADVADAVRRAAIDVGLHAPALSFRTLQDVVEQTRAAARTREAAAGRDRAGVTR